ncbi:MAG: EpsI family protein [Armatimonadetes bacterium]|nr:EpsI family protein [Armatimonadota bacterium]MDE2205685.1 EpsI family protein [Armatimonadota bacterium]
MTTRLLVINSLAAVMLLAAWAIRPGKGPVATRHLASLHLALPGWTTATETLPPSEDAMLQAQDVLLQDYTLPGDGWLDFALIVGSRRQSLHRPEACLAGDGWVTLQTEPVTLKLDGLDIHAERSLLNREGHLALVTWFFTDGSVTTPGQVQLLLRQVQARLAGGRGDAALVRVMTAVTGKSGEADAVTRAFLARNILTILRAAGPPAANTAGANQ